MTAVMEVLGAIADERRKQDEKWGEQTHPNGTGCPGSALEADLFRAACNFAAKTGTVTWAHILLEETYEALAETDPATLREELVQLAAVAAAWIECIDRTIADA